jgi:hypothetical protein
VITARRIRPSICRGWLRVDGTRSGKIGLRLQGDCGRGQTRRGRGWGGAVCFGPLPSLRHAWLSWPFVGRPLTGHDEEAATNLMSFSFTFKQHAVELQIAATAASREVSTRIPRENNIYTSRCAQPT